MEGTDYPRRQRIQVRRLLDAVGYPEDQRRNQLESDAGQESKERNSAQMPTIDLSTPRSERKVVRFP